jgi:hypothetical protein
MKRIIMMLTVAAIMVVAMSVAAPSAFAAKTETFERGTCTVKAGQGGGSGSIKDQHHGQCGSQGADV